MPTSLLLVWVAVVSSWVRGQYIGEENLDSLQQTAVIDGERRDLDLIGPTITTNKTIATLNCEAGFMNVLVTFDDPFYGIIYPNGSRNSPCLVHGDGTKQAVIILPLKGCGTHTVDRRVFVNNIIVRFHKGLELPVDEVKTIICRYPSPVVIQAPPPVPRIADPPPIPPARIGEVEILMIICAIFFLALLLVGMACSYTCLKKRNIRIVRRRALSGPPSEISRISGSSLIFDGLKIPRAHATSTSDSDTAIVSQSETLPSDYPSESPSSGSEIEEIDVQEDKLSSVYSDAMVQSEIETIPPPMAFKPPSLLVRVKRALTPPRTPEPDYPIQSALAQSLTTILESDESFHGSRPGSERAVMLTESEADYNPPVLPKPPPEFTQVAVVQRPKVIDVQHIENVRFITQEITDVEETVERGKRRYMAPIPPSEPDSDYPSEVRSVSDVVEGLQTAIRPPEILETRVDDRFVTTSRETHTTEDIEKHRRFIKQYHMKPKPLPPQKWDVAIRHYPGPKYADEMESSGPEWEAYSEPGSDVFRAQMLEGIDDRLSQIDVEHMVHPPPPNWPVLLRVLEPPHTEEAITTYLSEEDREKWRQIITTESTLRTMLTTATVREDYERIRRDQRYEKLFEPRKWDVIIRILSPPDPHRTDETSSEAPTMSDGEGLPPIGKRYRKHESMMTKKISLPPVHEYDSEGNPIVRRIVGPPSSRSRRSSVVSGEVRSIAETEVNFARIHVDAWSEASGPATSVGPRSHADRSHSEITFAAPTMRDDEYPDIDFDDRLSGRTGRSLARSASEFTEDWRHHDPTDGVSLSSMDSKPHQHRSKPTSEYLDEPSHLSDFQTSPESSPQLTQRRYAPYHHHHYEDSQRFGAMRSEHLQEMDDQYVTEQRERSDRVYTREIRSSRTQSGYRHESYRDDRDDPISKF